jgi:hypothetical protein
MSEFFCSSNDIVSSNIPLYAYTNNSVLIGPILRFATTPSPAAAPQQDPEARLAEVARDAVRLTLAPEYRLEGGLGGAFGSNRARGSVTSGSVTVDTGNVSLDGNGLAAHVALWADGPLATWTANPAFGNFSFGIEYRHLDNSERANVSATVPSLGATIPGSVTGDFHSENLFANAAWRLNSGVVHPYLGAGAGVAVIDWTGKLNAPTLAALSPTTPTSFSAGVVSAVAAAHTFVGLDYDVAPNFYIGAGGDFYFTDTVTKQFSRARIRLNANQLSLLAHAGFRF